MSPVLPDVPWEQSTSEEPLACVSGRELLSQEGADNLPLPAAAKLLPQGVAQMSPYPQCTGAPGPPNAKDCFRIE